MAELLSILVGLLLITLVTGRNKMVCTPGKPFIPDGDCNFCTCADDGQSGIACSVMTCFRARSVKDEPCPRRGRFLSKDGCNKCRCDMQKIAMCSKKKCEKK
uniref:Protease inhibitor n=1 Tax=Panstrongylus lignarius TaxID=156445 RepID=A0A224Y2W2_9HEMI